MTVRDTGIGIPAEALPQHLRHVQPGGPLARAERPAGWASGWRWCKGLVEMHGGTVEAASDGPGAGSTFTVALPATGRAARAEPSKRRPKPARRPGRRGGSWWWTTTGTRRSRWR